MSVRNVRLSACDLDRVRAVAARLKISGEEVIRRAMRGYVSGRYVVTAKNPSTTTSGMPIAIGGWEPEWPRDGEEIRDALHAALLSAEQAPRRPEFVPCEKEAEEFARAVVTEIE